MRGRTRVKTLPVKLAGRVTGKFQNFHKTGSVLGMRKQYYGRDALLVRCGSFIYNVTSEPKIYHELAH
jgi:hypothetical protein